jgi:hypothetical protein
MANKLFSALCKNTYVGATAYTVGDIVDYNGSSYACKLNSTGNVPTNTTYWALLASKGDKGDTGSTGATGAKGDKGAIGVDWQGAWSAGSYTVTQAVSHNGSSWIATTTTTEEPSISATDWDLIALKGTDGVGTGDVLGPATNTADYIPQWNGTDSKTLKNGLGLDTDLSSVSASDDTIPSAKATKAMGDLKLAIASKATAAEVATGTDDTKYTTALAVQPYSNQSLYRQAIINGNFDVWQRGTTITNPSSGAYLADRWYTNGTNGNTTVTRQTTGVPIGSQYCLRSTQTNTSYLNLGYVIESTIVSKLIGKTVTVSAKVRRNSDYNTTLSFAIYKNSTADTSSGGTFVLIDSVVVSNANLPTGTTSADWYTISFSFAIPADGTANGLKISVEEGVQTPNGAYYEIAQVQLCAGSVALPFQPKSFAEELRDCQRYYELIGTGIIGRAESASVIWVGGKFAVPKRATPATPTLTVTTPSILEINVGSRTGTDSTFSSQKVDTTAFYGEINGFGGVLTSPNMVVMTGNFIACDSEL